jgi:hypothetical protein
MREHVRETTTNHAPIYGLGLIGALFYYIGAASGFWGVIVGIIKALLWPAFLVYEALGALAG